MDALKVEVVSSDLVERRYQDRNNEDQVMKGQLVYVHVPNKRYPVEMFRRLAKGERSGLAAGWYELDMERFFVNYQFSRLEFSLSFLKPCEAPAAAASKPQQRAAA